MTLAHSQSVDAPGKSAPGPWHAYFATSAGLILSLSLVATGLWHGWTGATLVQEARLEPHVVASTLLSSLVLAGAHFAGAALLWRAPQYGSRLSIGLSFGGLVWALGALTFDNSPHLQPVIVYFALLALSLTQVVRGWRAPQFFGLALLQAPTVLFVGVWRFGQNMTETNSWILVLAPALFVYLLLSGAAADALRTAPGTLLRKRALLAAAFATTAAAGHPEIFRAMPVGIAFVCVIVGAGAFPLMLRTAAWGDTKLSHQKLWSQVLLGERLAVARAGALVAAFMIVAYLGLYLAFDKFDGPPHSALVPLLSIAWVTGSFLAREHMTDYTAVRPGRLAPTAWVGFAGLLILGVLVGLSAVLEADDASLVLFPGGIALAILGYPLTSETSRSRTLSHAGQPLDEVRS